MYNKIIPTLALAVVVLIPLAAHADFQDGDLVRPEHNSAVWVIKRAGTKVFRRWLAAPQIVAAYGQLKAKPIQIVSKAEIDAIPASYLVRREGDTKVYETWNIVEGKTADLRWIPTTQDFLTLGFNFDAVYTINSLEFRFYKTGDIFRAPSQ